MKALDFLSKSLLIMVGFVIVPLSCTDGPLDDATPLDSNSVVELSLAESANCYIVSQYCTYKFKTVKGNSAEVISDIESCEVLWESFGTLEQPEKKDLIDTLYYKDGYVTFKTSEEFKEGNAVIAVKNDKGDILWSWHIWMTDKPKSQTYNNGAGVVMDRNLGATSANPGEIGCLGLLYQWGRKDPFLGSGDTKKDTIALSTATWYTEHSSESIGTIEYSISHPTTFIKTALKVDDVVVNQDWYFTKDGTTDDTRWTTSEKEKSIYDPCPPGWRVPDGGRTGIWAKSSENSGYFEVGYDKSNSGMNFKKVFCKDNVIWYPSCGSLTSDGVLKGIGYFSHYWSASINEINAYNLYINDLNSVHTSNYCHRTLGNSVRCVQN